MSEIQREDIRLNSYHVDVATPFIVELLNSLGEGEPITNATISDVFEIAHGRRLNPGVVRVIIHNIRTKGLVKNLIADRSGYRVCTDTVEMREYLAELYNRSMSVLEVYAALKEQAETVFGKQLELNINQ